MKSLRISMTLTLALALTDCGRAAGTFTLDTAAARGVGPSGQPGRDAAAAADPARSAPFGELPRLDRSVLAEPEDKLRDPEARARNHVIMDQLWTTNLGQEYLAYLTDPTPAEYVPGRALRLVDRIYAQGEHLGKRQKAIEAFSLDLYARGRLSEDMLARSLIYDKIAKQKETDGMDKNSSVVITLAIAGGVAAMVIGSPAARAELMNLRALVWNRCRLRSCASLAEVDWRKMLHPRSFSEKYQPLTTWNTFAAIAGGGSMVYSFVFEKLPGFQRGVDLDREMLNGRENLLIELEF